MLPRCGCGAALYCGSDACEFRRFEIPAALAHRAGGEKKGGEWEEEQALRAASRQMGPPAPGGRTEGFPAGSVFDPARFQDVIGESGGAGNFNSPRN